MEKLILVATPSEFSKAMEMGRWASSASPCVEMAAFVGPGADFPIASDLGRDGGIRHLHRIRLEAGVPSTRESLQALSSLSDPARVGWIAPVGSPLLDALVSLVVRAGGIVADRVRDLRLEDGTWHAEEETHSGQFLRTVAWADGTPFLALVSAVPGAPSPRPVECSASDTLLRPTELVESAWEADPVGTETDLSRAPAVLAIGDGVGRKGALEARKIVACAELLGVPMALGGTRVVTDAGTLPRRSQIGVSGVSVAPRLLLSVGASGAPQHWAGIRDARTILAVNTDPGAPILSRVDRPVVGDGLAFLKAVRTGLFDLLDAQQKSLLESRNAPAASAPTSVAVPAEPEEPLSDQPLRVDFRSLEFDAFEVFGMHRLDPAWNREKLSALLRKAGRFAETRLNQGKRDAERRHCRMHPGEEHRERAVTAPPRLKDAFQEYYRSGLGKFALPRIHGGMGLSHGFLDLVSEIVNGGSVAMGTCFELTMGASLILRTFGNEWMKEVILPGLHDGRFQGTMCLTEAQAGSDLGAVATVAERIEGTDKFRLRGTKVFITSGDHDMAENFMHIVLARIQGVSQKGTGAISLFLVPKFQVDEEGVRGEFNHVVTQGLEHKHGMTTSPTVTLKFEDAEGWLIAPSVEEEIRRPSGMKAMFFFMNYMRHETGTAARGQSMATCLDVLEYNLQREQGTALRDAAAGSRAPSPIFRHPSQRKILLDMFARTLGGRLMTLRLAQIRDRSHQELAEGLAGIESERGALGLASAEREELARLEAERSDLRNRRAKGIAARKALAPDPDGTALNEKHLTDVEERLRQVSARMAGIHPRWEPLLEGEAALHQAERDEETYAMILTSLVKAQVTDDNIRTLNEGMNAYGGIGYMDETPVSQRLRDSQILCIWEGTNDIQALNTVLRQIGPRNTDSRGRVVWNRLMAELGGIATQNGEHPRLASSAALLQQAIAALMEFRNVLVEATPESSVLWNELLGRDPSLAGDEKARSLRRQELVQAWARTFSTWFAQVVEGAQLLAMARVASDLLDAASPEWEGDFLEGRIELAKHFLRSPAGLDKGLLAWRLALSDLVPDHLDRAHLADQAERLLA